MDLELSAIEAHSSEIKRVCVELRVSENKKPVKKKKKKGPAEVFDGTPEDDSSIIVPFRGVLKQIWGLNLDRKRARVGGLRQTCAYTVTADEKIARLAKMSDYEERGEGNMCFRPVPVPGAHASYSANFQEALAAARARSLSVDNLRL